MERCLLRRFALASALAVLSLAGTTSPAAASVTIGQSPSSPPGAGCSSATDRVQGTVTSGDTYVVPATVAAGTITSWITRANTAGGALAMKVYRPLGGTTYQVVGHEGPHALQPNVHNVFAANVPVKAGDVLGISTPADAGLPGCYYPGAPGNTYLTHFPNLADGQSADFTPVANRRLNIAAVVNPTNSFTLGAVTRNKKKGIAFITATFPNPGGLTLSGKALKALTKTASGPGTVKLTIRAKGKKMRKLNETGKVKVKPKVTYTPTGGDASSQSVKVKLKKKL